MDSPFERPQNPTPPPSSPSTPLEGGEFLFPSASNVLTRQISQTISSDGYETDSQLGDDVPLSLTASSSMESLPTDEQSPFLLAPLNSRFFGGYGGKNAYLPLTLSRFMLTYRRNSLNDDSEDTAKRMRTDSVESGEDETPTDESTFIVEPKDDKKEKSDDDDLYEF